MSIGRRRTAAALAAAAFVGVVGGAALSPAAQAAAAASPGNADWILSAQLPDGALAHYPDRAAVWPYLSNFAAIGLAQAAQQTGNPHYTDAAWRWLTWYQQHEDASGFVTDYRIEDGTQVSTGTMDSTDSYAGTFLLAAQQAFAASNDTSRLATMRPGITGAVDAIAATQDSDGLTWAQPSWHVKYLMDQAETYAGLRAAVELAGRLGDAALGARAGSMADRLAAGVASLWNPATGSYDWAKHGDGNRTATRWNVLYPDALEQAWPVAFGLVDGQRAAELMRRFDAAQPTWDQPGASATFDTNGTLGSQPVGYWPIAAWGFSRTGDSRRAAAATASIDAASRAAGRAWPFTTGTAGNLLGAPRLTSAPAARPARPVASAGAARQPHARRPRLVRVPVLAGLLAHVRRR